MRQRSRLFLTCMDRKVAVMKLSLLIQEATGISWLLVVRGRSGLRIYRLTGRGFRELVSNRFRFWAFSFRGIRSLHSLWLSAGPQERLLTVFCGHFMGIRPVTKGPCTLVHGTSRSSLGHTFPLIRLQRTDLRVRRTRTDPRICRRYCNMVTRVRRTTFRVL